MGRFNPDSRDPVVSVTTWSLLVAAWLSVLSRLISKYHLVHQFTSDDYLIIASGVFCTAQSVAVSIMVANGYGEHIQGVSHERFETLMKTQYVASLLYITSLYLSKLSLCRFVRNLSPKSRDHRLATAVQSITTAWVITSLLATAFQCPLAQTWNYLQDGCINLIAWQYFFCGASLMTDMSLIGQALYLIVRLHAPIKKRCLFASIFLTRILVLGAIVAELVLVQNPTRLVDPTYEYCYNTVVMQLVQCSSIVTACWPQLKPFLNQMKSNGMRIPGAECTVEKSSQSRSRSQGHSELAADSHDLVPIPHGQGNLTTVSTTWDSQSQSSQVGMIRETRTWMVTDSSSL